MNTKRCAFRQAFLGCEFEVLESVCCHFKIPFVLYCHGKAIKASQAAITPETMLLETDCPSELINLKLATTEEDVHYFPLEVKHPKLVQRLDLWLGMPEGSIEPCPAQLPFTDPAYFTRNIISYEEKYKVSQKSFHLS